MLPPEISGGNKNKFFEKFGARRCVLHPRTLSELILRRFWVPLNFGWKSIFANLAKNRQNLQKFFSTFWCPRYLCGWSTAKPLRMGLLGMHVSPRRVVVCHLAYRGVTLESRCKMDSSGGILGSEIACMGRLDNFSTVLDNFFPTKFFIFWKYRVSAIQRTSNQLHNSKTRFYWIPIPKLHAK